MLRKRGRHRRRIVVGVVIHAAPHQLPGVGPRHIDDQRPFDELPLIQLGLPTGAPPAATLLDRPPLAIEPEVDATHAAFDHECRPARRLGEASLGERASRSRTKHVPQHERVQLRMRARGAHVPDHERPQLRELDLVVHEHDIVVGPGNGGHQPNKRQTGNSAGSHGGYSIPRARANCWFGDTVTRMSRHSALIAALLLLCLGTDLLTQAPQRFEVASIKARPPAVPVAGGGTGGGPLGRQGQRFNAVDRSLRDIIRHAYTMEAYETIENGPGWLDDHFDITAVIPQSATAPDAYRTMLQTLLAERFKLDVRWSTRDMPVYSLVAARRDGRLGPGLKASTTDCRDPRRPQVPAPGEPSLTTEQLAALTKPACDMVYQPFRARIYGGGRTMDDLALILSRIPALKAPVVNRTSLTGRFDFELVYASERQTPSPAIDSPPSLFVALEEQLGLKLESSRGEVKTLVVNRLERLTPD